MFEGFVRAGAAIPRVRVGDVSGNCEAALDLWQRAHDEGCAVVFFPELGLTGYTAGDLFLNRHLQDAAIEGLAGLLAEGERRGLCPLAFVGLPLLVSPGLYNVAAALQGGRLLGIVPKSYLPNYREFYEQRQFREGREVPPGRSVDLLGRTVPFGTDLLFAAENLSDLVVGAEICEDGWVQLSPNAFQTSAGATVCGNLSASDITIGKSDLRHRLCWKASDPGKCAYIYVAAGPGESSADVTFDAQALIYENGRCLAESQRFSRGPQLITADIDLELLIQERVSTGSFGACAAANQHDYRRLSFTAHAPSEPVTLRRRVEAHPFVPSDPATLADRCREVFLIQTTALITRLESLGSRDLVLGLSGGRDSTLAALACAAALDDLGAERRHLHCITMPGFGTTKHSREAARQLATALGADFEEQDIRAESLLVLEAQHHPLARGYSAWSDDTGRDRSIESFTAYLSQHAGEADVEFENIQARIRTLRLMTRANRLRGLEIGTGDLSEKALGWSTYAGDHISMYDLNAGIPKTLVEFVIRWVATEESQRWAAGDPDELRRALDGILLLPISPELLPPDADGAIAQISESAIGPYELHDFFLFWFLRHGARPRRILTLAQAAFGERYSKAEILRWLRVFLERFFSSQWKRDCTADGPKVGTTALSPRGDWRMPSDASVQSWIEELQSID
jgi:NAD+ synthase (glutamine-hydrolysing)